MINIWIKISPKWVNFMNKRIRFKILKASLNIKIEEKI